MLSLFSFVERCYLYSLEALFQARRKENEDFFETIKEEASKPDPECSERGVHFF